MSQLYVDNIKNRTGGAIGAPAGIVVSGVGTFSGNVSIGGTLTYEDVTNIDSVGIITARSGVKVPDAQKIFLGTGDDLQIYHDGSNSYIADTGTGDLRFRGSKVVIQNAGGTASVLESDGTTIELYHNNTKRFETSATGVIVNGTVSDSIGPLRRLGSNIKTSNYTLVAADAGKMVRVDNGSTITVPDNVFTTGDMITIVSGSSSNVPITEGTNVTLYNASDGTDGSVTLAARTVCTILVASGGSSSKIYIAGGGIS